MTPEGRIKKLVKAKLAPLVENHQCWAFMPVQSGFGIPALDFLLCINGWFVAIETKKSANAKLTDRQQATKRDMEEAGGIVLVVYDEASLDRAMKIIDIICIGNKNADRELRAILAPWIAAQAQRPNEQHPSAEQPAQAADQAAGRDHGAPRKKSQRRPVTGTGRDDPAVTAAVTGCECKSIKGSLGEPLIQLCAYCKAKGF